MCRSAGCGLESGNIDKLTVTALGINISSKCLDLNNIIENSKTIRIFVVLKSCAGGEMVDALVSGASVNCDV